MASAVCQKNTAAKAPPTKLFAGKQRTYLGEKGISPCDDELTARN